MSWVTLDDAACLHRKQVAAGAVACWLWTCGLAYCDRQDAKDGFIPEPVIKSLYPGLGKKQADALVKVGLWEKVDAGYVVHDYLEWRERRFSGVKSSRGSAGGSVSSEAKRQAALDREAAKRLAQQTTTDDHNESTTKSTTSVTTTTSPTDRRGSGSDRSGSETGSDAREPEFDDPGRETLCPPDLDKKAEENGTLAKLAEKLPAPIAAVRAAANAYVRYFTIGKGMGERGTAWMGRMRQRIVSQHAAGTLCAPPGALAHASRPPAEDLPPAPAHESFESQERAHATRLAKALAGDYGPKLAAKAADMPASQLRAVVERLERGRPTAVGNLLAGVGRAAE